MDTKNTKTEITPFEVAQLAVQMDRNIRNSGVHPEPAIHRAILILRSAERALEQEQKWKDQLSEMLANVLTIEPNDWNQRIDEFGGDQRALRRMLNELIPSEKVHRALFKNKSHTAKNRKDFFMHLGTWAKNNGMGAPPMCENLAPETDADKELLEWAKRNEEPGLKWLRFIVLPVYVVRWAMEVREKQLAVNKSRNVPASLKRERQNDGDSIQFKRKYSA